MHLKNLQIAYFVMHRNRNDGTWWKLNNHNIKIDINGFPCHGIQTNTHTLVIHLNKHVTWCGV